MGAGNVSSAGFPMILCRHTILTVGVRVGGEDSGTVALPGFYDARHDSFSGNDDRHNFKRKQMNAPRIETR